MKRVAVIGSPGAGKTIFSRKLAEKTSLPLVHLDIYYNDEKLGFKEDRAAWEKLVSELVAKPEWIMDGNYGSTFPLRFERADTIIFLDYKRWRALMGVYKRRLQYHSKLRPDMPEGWREKTDRNFMRYVWNFNKKSRSIIFAAAEPDHHQKMIIFRKPKDAENYLRSLPPKG